MTGRPRLENPRRLPRHLRNEDIPSNTFTPRAYQVELLDSAIKRNSIICLGSSTGKTFIAVMVLRELSHQVRPPLTQNGKRSVFLVNNESHLSEKAKIIEHHTDLNIGSYTTEQNTDDWSSEKWGQEINSKHILVTTPKIFYSLLEHGHLNCPQLNVVVFEDCHLATSDEFHNKILDYLHSYPNKEQPKILGLTSCFLSSKCLDPLLLEKSVVSLEEKLKCTAETSSLVISERYGIKPKEIIFECDNYEDTTGMVESLGDILERSFEFLQECNILLDEDKDDDDRDPTQIPKTAISECLNILYKLGPWCAAHIAQMLVTQIEKIDKHERVSIHKTFLKYCATQLRLISTMFEQDFKPDYDVEELLTYTTPKVRKLINHLRKFKPNCDFMIISSEEMDDEELDDMDNDSFMSDDSDFIDTDDDEHDEKSRSPKLIHIAVKKENEETEVDKKTFDPLFTEDNPYLCGIVFVDHRYVALALNKFIEEVCSWDEQLCFIKSQQISAHSQKGSAAKKEGGKIYKKQEEILRKFRLQEINLLISTNVLEDGIDLPKCNLVVKFDSPKDYRSYCQSKGRARARDAEYVLMVEEYALESFRKDIQMYKGIEQILIGRGRAKDDTDDDIGIYISEEEEHKYEDILPPYSAGEGCPSVSLSNSLALINRYCAKLPSDAFTHLTPHCTIQQISQDGNPMYIAKLRLPINSPIKNELQGIPMTSKTLAKKAVALKMCEMLHKAGELDEQLMPVGKELFILEEEDNTEWSEEDVSGEARPGTTKRKQYYVKKIASALLQSHPKIKNNLIYILNLKLTKPISDDQNTRGRKIYDPEENNSTFGLVTCNEIPQIPQFPVYTRSGEVTVSISLLKENVEFTEEELSKFKDFHEFVFANVLRLEKDPMDFSPDQADVGYLIVPLLRDIKTCADWMVDFDFMEKVEKSKFVEKRNIYDSKQDKFEFVEAEYDDAVVMPAYRNIDQPQHFYVAEIRYDLNPISPFPSPELYKTFSEYYNAKYGLTITNLEQPLLDVDHTSARLNLLTPRYMNQKGVALPTSSAETKKARRENLQQKQILVPELCEVHVFPASLWRIAVCLPAVMYRTNYLLVAEEIRIKIASETGIGVAQIPEDFTFPPLDFGFQQTGAENIEKIEDESPENATESENVENAKKVGENSSENPTEIKNDQDSMSEENDKGEKIIDESMSTQDKKSKEFSVMEEEKAGVCIENGFDSDPIDKLQETESSSGQKIQNLNQNNVCDEKVSVCKELNKILCKNCGAVCERNGYCNKIDSRDQSNFQENAGMSGNCPHCNTKTNKDIVQNNGAVTKSNNEICENELICNVENLSFNEIPNISGDQLKQSEIPCNKICNNDSSHKDQESKDSDLIFNGANNQVSMETQHNKCNTELEVHNNSEGKDVETVESDVFSNVTYFGKDEKNKPKKCSLSGSFEEEYIPEPLLSLDEDIDLGKFIGPSPCTILQALTMSNANDFFSLERLETIGDSFLKYAITVYLYCSYPGIHEGKLSYLRSKQVSNCNLYRLGKRKCLAECMISTKFEPYENWLPPGFVINEDKRKGPVPKVLLAGSTVKKDSDPRKRSPSPSKFKTSNSSTNSESDSMHNSFTEALEEIDSEDQDQEEEDAVDMVTGSQCLIPYSLQTLHSIPDKSIADCVESLIGCYLTSCGKKAALMFMSWLGLKVLPRKKKTSCQENLTEEMEFNTLKCPSSPLLTCSPNARELLNHLLIGYEALEEKINYKFNDRSYLLQAFTHASYHYNTVTDCYQRLEFLGDAILDYVITRHLYEDSCKYSPGVLTDLRSALVNNNIFAALAVKWDFHKYFKAISPSLFHVIDKFVSRQKEREDEIDLDSDNEDDEEEGQEKVELEVPKALGDIFESLAGAIYLDSGMSLDVVWRVYYRIMKPQIDKYLKSIPKSPVRELLEMEPETAKFERPERTLEGKIRVTVNVVGKGQFTGIGRNYRIAKSASAKKALRCIKTMQVQGLI